MRRGAQWGMVFAALAVSMLSGCGAHWSQAQIDRASTPALLHHWDQVRFAGSMDDVYESQLRESLLSRCAADTYLTPTALARVRNGSIAIGDPAWVVEAAWGPPMSAHSYSSPEGTSTYWSYGTSGGEETSVHFLNDAVLWWHLPQ